MSKEIQTPQGTEGEVIPPNNELQNGGGAEPVIEPKEPQGNEPVEPTSPTDPTPPQPPVVPPVVPPAPPVAPAPAVDYKKKFGESTRQNQIVVSQFKELQKVLGDITKQEIPSEDEMRKLEPDYEYLSDREKANAMKMVVLERRQNLILKTIGDISSESEIATKLDEFITGEPRLKGKEDAFIAFSTKPSNKGASMEVLLNAFLFEVKEPVAPVTPPTPADDIPPSLERGSPSGSGAPRKTGKTEYSDEELTELRTKNPKKYHEMIRKGQI